MDGILAIDQKEKVITENDSRITQQAYPMVEEMTFRAIINSEKEGYALLRAIQMLVNEMGANTIITLMDKIEKKPNLLMQAKNYLPYILKL